MMYQVMLCVKLTDGGTVHIIITFIQRVAGLSVRVASKLMRQIQQMRQVTGVYQGVYKATSFIQTFKNILQIKIICEVASV